MFSDLRLLSLLGALLYIHTILSAQRGSAVFGKPVTGSFLGFLAVSSARDNFLNIGR